jgi:3-deoxy-7-phosphoheptulonate synthase
MILILKKGISDEEIESIVLKIKDAGLTPHISKGNERVIIGLVGDSRAKDRDYWLSVHGVEDAIRVLKPFKLASREFKSENTVITVDGIKIGGNEVVVMAGPCAVEGREQLLQTAEIVKNYGAKILRGGAFKPRTSPYSFKGLGKEGLMYLKEAKEKFGLPVVTEVMSIEQIEDVSQYADIIQIGARNMQNFSLLEEVGKTRKPILLKRGLSAKIEEFLLAAEYILFNGNPNVILCERGIRTFETYTRNTLDISAVPVLKSLTHLPVIVDPSHAIGLRDYIIPVSLASIAAGADGLIVEVHPEPEKALSDGAQSLYPEQFKELMEKLKKVGEAVGRPV